MGDVRVTLAGLQQLSAVVGPWMAALQSRPPPALAAPGCSRASAIWCRAWARSWRLAGPPRHRRTASTNISPKAIGAIIATGQAGQVPVPICTARAVS